MDTYELKSFNIDDFVYNPQHFVEYEDGKQKSFGSTGLKIIVANKSNKISVEIQFNDMNDKLKDTFVFDTCIGSWDRLLLYSLPRQTNADIILLTTLRNICPFTRDYKIYAATEPVACSLFTSNGFLVKVSFTFANPERLIEFY